MGNELNGFNNPKKMTKVLEVRKVKTVISDLYIIEN